MNEYKNEQTSKLKLTNKLNNNLRSNVEEDLGLISGKYIIIDEDWKDLRELNW